MVFIFILCIFCRALLIPCLRATLTSIVQYCVLDNFLKELFKKLFDLWRSVDLFPYELVILYKVHS